MGWNGVGPAHLRAHTGPRQHANSLAASNRPPTPMHRRSFFLLARDGVPLPVIPRKLRSNPTPPAGGRRPCSPPRDERRGYGPHHSRRLSTRDGHDDGHDGHDDDDGHGDGHERGAVSDLILGPANRADVLLKCNKPGTYVLASGAGPFHTNFNGEQLCVV